ncbi:MAG: hypothetical protein MK106_08690 [Mariniblastus sp.]|nr:hypothetical protein [Mariniblastus sp.]
MVLGVAARRLPVILLILLVLPLATGRAVVELFLKNKTSASFWKLNKGLTKSIAPVPLAAIFRARVRLGLNRLMTYWGDQLRDPKWKARIEYSGLEEVLERLNSGQSVLLTSLHYGAPREASTILRSLGLRLSALASDDLSLLEKKAVEIRDGLWCLEDAPVILTPKELWRTRDLLMRPRSLLLLLVDRNKNQRDLSGSLLGGQVQIAKGFVTLAQITEAVVVPFACTGTGFLKWRLWFGKPMDATVREGMQNKSDLCQRVLDELAAEIGKYPEQFQPQLIGAMLESEVN